MADDASQKLVQKNSQDIELSKISDEIDIINNSNNEKANQIVDSEQQTERKITQTDHLNKKLLSSFLDRLNTGDNSVSFVLKQQDNRDQSVDEDFEI